MAKGFRLIAANAGTSKVAVSSNSAGSWTDQQPDPGVLPQASVAIAGNGAEATAAAGAALWTTRKL